jgi:predicted DNA-binding transcriptional regulator YafY
MPDVSRFEKTQIMIRLGLEIAARRHGVTTKEAHVMLNHLLEEEVSERTPQRMLNGLAAAFSGFHKDEETGRWRWEAREIPAVILGANPKVWPDLRQAAQIMLDRGDEAAAARLNALSQQVAAQNMSDKQKRDKRDAVVRALETEALLYRPGPCPLFEAETLECVRDALREGRTLQFDYEKGDGSITTRTVVPYGVLLGEIAYLVGPSEGKDLPVLWRLDRMIEPILTETRYEIPKDFDLEAYANRSFGTFQGEDDVAVTLRILPHATAKAEYHRFHISQTQEWLEDGSLRVHLYGRSLQELALQLLPWGGKLVVEGPEALREAVRAAGERVAEMIALGEAK